MKKFLAQNWFKIVLTLILFVVVLGGIIVFYFGVSRERDKKQENEYYFLKKQECVSYKSEMEEDLISDIFLYFLDEIFFSPSRNSCLYSFISPITYKDKTGTMYYITDYFTNENIFSVSTLTSDTAMEYFETKKEELKQ